MKKIFAFSALTCLAMICACQRKDSTAQQPPPQEPQQLSQQTTELAARQEAFAEKLNSLEEKVNSLSQRVKELAEKGTTTMSARSSPNDIQSQPVDAAQIEAEKERLIQQLSAMIPERSKVTAGDPARQQRSGRRQLSPEDLQRQWQQSLDQAKRSAQGIFPAAESASPTPSATPE